MNRLRKYFGNIWSLPWLGKSWHTDVVELPKSIDRKYLVPSLVVILGLAMLGLGQENGWVIVTGGLLLGALRAG